MDEFMAAAREEAEAGKADGGIPIGAVLVYGGQIIARGRNRRVQSDSPILHAEMDLLQNAGRLAPSIYRASTLYTTLSPCSMCSGAILLYGIPHVVIGENLSFKGEEELLKSRGIRVDVLQDQRCMMLMMAFINENQELWFEDIGRDAP
ncbi:MAG TPA: nucleoside deaminase [Nitrospirota bacterium]|nr:nucleoside deaminase [Nitrospirota bacterium]